MKTAKDLKILVAEDNPINQRIAKLTFNQLGLNVDFAADGNEALEMFAHKQYDLIFMDIQMPVMDGLEAIRQIRGMEVNSESNSRAFIVVLTASEMQDKLEECCEAGCDLFMEKPFQKRKLQDLLVRWS